MDIDAINERLRRFAAERDWEQFHTPKNLVMGLAGEVGELIELFQWLSPEESAAVMDDAGRARAVRDELADVTIYALRLADKLGIELEQAIWDKMAANEAKYPADRVRGSAVKYTEL